MTNTYNRRQFLTHSAAAAGGVVAGGMLLDELVDASPAGAVTRGGTLNVGIISQQNQPFNPAWANMDTSGFMIGRCIYDPLCVTSANAKEVYPYLAKSVTSDKTYKNWTITARPGVTFHDGTPCNGDAIYANMVENYNSSLTGPAISGVLAAGGVTKAFSHTPGSDTVVVHTRYKWTTFPYTLAEQQIGFIAAPSTLGSGYTGKPIGTGPFMASAPVGKTNTFTLTKNPSYWQAGFPYLGAVTFNVIVDSPTRLTELQEGTIDLAIMTDAPSVKAMKSLGSGFNVLADYPGNPVYSPSTNCIMLNCSKPPFNNQNLRLGCAYAIDTTTYVSVVDGGFSTPTNGLYLKGSPYYNNPKYPVYDVKTAKSYISKVPSGDRSFTLTYVTGDQTILDAAEFIQSELSVVGVTASLNGVTQGTLINDAIFGTYQALTWADFGGVCPDTNYPWFSTKTGNVLYNLNFARDLDPKIQTMMVSAFGATSDSARYKAWAKVNDQIDLDVPYLWTDRVVLGVGASKAVQNWQTFSFGSDKILQPNQAVLFLTATWK